MTQTKQERFQTMINNIKSEFGTCPNPYPNKILEESLKAYYGMSIKNKQFIIDALVRMIVITVQEDKFYPIDFSYPTNEYPKDEEEYFSCLLEDFNIKLGDFLRNGRGIKAFLGFLAEFSDPFDAVNYLKS